jgi:hypothetical protein
MFHKMSLLKLESTWLSGPHPPFKESVLRIDFSPGIDSLESMLGVRKSLKNRALTGAGRGEVESIPGMGYHGYIYWGGGGGWKLWGKCFILIKKY